MKEGEVYTNNLNQKLKILNLDHIDSNYRKYFKVIFLDTGYIDVFRSDTIKQGAVRDNLTPNKLGGKLGYASSKGKNKRFYKVWYGILSRCYNKKDKHYKEYGLKGVYVCERWKRFDYFLEDIVNCENFNLDLFNEGKIFMDKDIKTEGLDKKYYSKETVVFLSNYENQNQRALEYRKKNKIYAIKNDQKIFIENVTKFCKENNIPRAYIYDVLNGKKEEVNGYKFIYEN